MQCFLACSCMHPWDLPAPSALHRPSPASGVARRSTRACLPSLLACARIAIAFAPLEEAAPSTPAPPPTMAPHSCKALPTVLGPRQLSSSASSVPASSQGRRVMKNHSEIAGASTAARSQQQCLNEELTRKPELTSCLPQAAVFVKSATGLFSSSVCPHSRMNLKSPTLGPVCGHHAAHEKGDPPSQHVITPPVHHRIHLNKSQTMPSKGLPSFGFQHSRLAVLRR